MSRDAIIGFDWSWDYRQGSSQCIFDFLNQRLKKIFDDDVAGNICSGLEGNFSSASSAMEVARLNNLLSLWKDNRLWHFMCMIIIARSGVRYRKRKGRLWRTSTQTMR